MFDFLNPKKRSLDQIQADIITTGIDLHGVTVEHRKALYKMDQLMRELKSIGGGSMQYDEALTLGVLSVKFCTYTYQPFKEEK